MGASVPSLHDSVLRHFGPGVSFIAASGPGLVPTPFLTIAAPAPAPLPAGLTRGQQLLQQLQLRQSTAAAAPAAAAVQEEPVMPATSEGRVSEISSLRQEPREALSPVLVSVAEDQAVMFVVDIG